MQYEFDTTVLNGLPVTIAFDYDKPDYSTGDYGGAYDWAIVAINNKPCKKSPDWLYKRIEASKKEIDSLYENINNYMDGCYE